MKRVPVLLVIMVALLVVPPTAHNSPTSISDESAPLQGPENPFSVSSASGSGDARTAVKFASRQVTGLTLPITNSYTSTNTHAGAIDLLGYLIPGWSLYKAEMEVDSMTAVAERETMGITPSTYIIVQNSSGLVTDALYQEFYNQPHDGKLENYTLSYICTYYSASLGHAYLGVRSDYTDPQTNMTSWLTPFTVNFIDTDVTHDVSSDNAILSTGTSYYVVIDGTGMQGVYAGGWWFNTIHWSATSSKLGLETGYNLRNDNWYIYEGIQRREAELNYTYTPWNQTSNSALMYSTPDQLSLKGNSTDMQGKSWVFTDPANITRIEFNTNQSISLDYNMTLWYKQAATTTPSWNIPSSGASVEWSVGTTIVYPGVTQANYLNFSIPATWDPSGLYNSTHTTTNHTSYSSTGTILTCSQMYDDTWTLKLTSENLLTTLKTYRSDDDTEVTTKSMMTSNIDINSTIQEPDTDPVTTGTANLVVWYSGSEFWSPSDQSVTNGLAHYFWDISNPMTTNGEYTIETRWSNGTEAGYLSKSLILYYPTAFTAESYNIDAYTESSFDIRVNLTDTFTPQGLNGTYATVVYSFDGAANQSMTDLNNGTWTATVSTAGKAFGQYDVWVYATGYAIENRSLQISTVLIHDTETLTILWSNTNDITYVESTELSVAYRRVGGAPISGATVNVTIDTNTWVLVWDGVSESYKITFNGSDSPPDFGVHSLTIQAWKVGHKPQTDASQTLTLQEESTTLTLQWSNGNSITYVESTTLIANYTMSDGAPVTGALVNVTIGTDTWIMTWNGVTETYDYVFDGVADPPGFGVYSLTIEAGRFGYMYQSDAALTLTLSEEPTSLVLIWSAGSAITYIESTTLVANYTQSDGTPVTGALVNVTIGTDIWTMTWNGVTETYDYVFDGDVDPPGLGLHSLTVEAGRFGYVYRSNSTLTLTINEEPTNLILTWSPDFDITYVEETYLIANYTMSNGSAVVGATVNVTIGTDVWILSWYAPTAVYRVLFKGSDILPGFGTHPVTVQADLFGFVAKTDSTETLTINEEPTTLLLSWSAGNSITYIEQTTLSASYTMSNGSAVRNAVVNVTIGLNTWLLTWHEGSQTYRVTFLGTDDPPGFGTHSVTVQADLFGFVAKSNSSEQLIISEEPTSMTISWSNGFSITYVEETTLSVWYNMSDATPITGATVTATIGIDVWILTWNPSTEAYETTFRGTDDPPGIGSHPLTIEAYKFGYVSQVDSTKNLVINLEPTSLQLTWWLSDTITYVEQTVLYANYTMSNGSAVVGAFVTVAIGSANKTFEWNPFSEVYSIVLSGNDPAYLLGVHSVTVQATLFGYEQRNDNTQTLTVQDEPTTLSPSWSPSNSISFIGSTVLAVRYDMSNGTAISGATVNATIGFTTWTLVWNTISEAYEHSFLGNDDPPGIALHNLIILADLYGFQNNSDLTQQLTISEEVTSLVLTWSPDNDITFVESTTLSANYTMSDGSPVLDAMVNVTIGSDTWTMIWNGATQTYDYVFAGNDAPPGLAVHSIIVEAGKFGYEYRIDSSTTLTMREEPTGHTTIWSPDNNMTYFESATLSVNYTMSNGTAIPGAVVNITIGLDVWVLTWNPVLEIYEVTIDGSDNPPGYGTHSVVLRASKFGYESVIDSSLQLIIRLEDTKISFVWIPSDTMTYIEQTKLRIFYRFINGTAVQGATVNITRGPTTWVALWNATSEAYEYTWLGTDDPPGLGTHPLVIKAWKANHVGFTDVSQTLTINEEPTNIYVSWSNGNNITYVQSTKLLVNYTTSGGITILGALVDVTIGADNWVLTWNVTSQLYEKTFSGSDSPPGLGTHSLSVRGWQFGYGTTVDSTVTLTFREEPTTLTPSWIPGNTITYIETTTLSVRYEMSNGNPITGAIVNVTIGTDVWTLVWNSSSEAYEYTFSGIDDPPGLGGHSLFIEASNWGFEYANNTLETLIITEGVTSLVIAWSNSDNISYVSQTTLSVRYQMSNTSAIEGAILNATINGKLWSLTWNGATKTYDVTIRGDDDPPGYGTYSVEIRASKFGFMSIIDTTQEFTIRLEETSVSYVWSPSDTITYTGQTKIRISYLMSNSTPIPGATVNITIGPTTWVAVWNDTSKAYEYTWVGTDDPPRLGTHVLQVQAWKVHYVAIVDLSQTFTINEEPTNIEAFWTDGNAITYVQFTTLQVNYTASDGSQILGATLNVTIGADVWSLVWNAGSGFYEITFNGADDPPGLGFHGLIIRAWKFGYELTTNSTLTLSISGELGSISSELLEGSTITFIGFTTLSVNYTMSNGTAIPQATVNVTIGGTLWNLTWHAASQTYRIQFNGTDSPPGFGTHNLIVHAWRDGFDGVSDSTLFLTIQEEGTSLDIYWGSPNLNNVTYFDYTILYVEYKMSNGTVIQGAKVNVTIDATTWTLEWNSTQGAYSLRFNGSDSPPSLGTHSLVIQAYKYGFEYRVDSANTLILSKDPTTMVVSWIGGNTITYVEQTTLSVSYKMSNGSDILGAIVNATINGTTWSLAWNGIAGAYQLQFTGDQDPPGLGTFSVLIQASADIYVGQTDTTSLTMQNEVTTATESWSSFTMDWTESVILSIDYKDSYGTLIDHATTKSIYINGTEYTLQGTNGTYWIQFNNTFDLGLHNVWVNFSKFGYDSSTVLSITFTITEAPTAFTIVWSSSVIDYLGHANMTVDYYYMGSGISVPTEGVLANITIDGITNIRLENRTNLWYVNLTGKSLDLGIHSIVIRAWAYGYEYSETVELVTVNEVDTDTLDVSWSPTNLTIEYTDSLNLTVDYTFYDGDVPAFAMVNVSISGRFYDLMYSGGFWRVSIPGSDLSIGLHTATITAWLYGYRYQMDVTTNINVTEAANSFLVTWEPWDLDASYTDTINASVVYTQDFSPIVGATVRLTINGTPHLLTYSALDEMWHFSMRASNIGLGIWNVTVTANKTGYADGWDSSFLSISPANTNLTVVTSAVAIYYDEGVTIDIYYQLLNDTTVPGATLTFTIDGLSQVATWDIDHWTYTGSGDALGLGNHLVYVHVVAFGFQAAQRSIDINVTSIPTSVTTPATIVSIFAYDSVTVSFTWIDDKNSVAIAGFIPEVNWPDSFTVVDLGNGTYNVLVDSTALHTGLYELEVNFVRIGYVNGSQVVNIELYSIPIALIFQDQIEQFENESILIEIEMLNAPHATVIDWGEILIELAGVQYNLLYDSSSETYSVEIWLSTLAPGNYTLNFTASAIDCLTVMDEIQLEIAPKIEYELVLAVDEEVQAGHQIQITVLATYESGTVDGMHLTLYIVVESERSVPTQLTETITTNIEGLALLEFYVPSEATRLTIWAEFDGAIGEWNAVSNIVIREVSPAGIDILSFIISIFEDPVTLVFIIGGIGLPVGGLLLRRRRRGPRTPIEPIPTETIAPPEPRPKAPAGEMEILQDKIKENPVGLTRAQVAQSLEISKSKAGALVRKLLESDPRFEEIKEGRLRLIRFREDE